MIFSDLIFVFAFLPVCTALTLCCREQWTKNAVWAAASLVFIAWGRPVNIWYYVLIALPVFLIYILGLLSAKIRPVVCEAIGGAAAVIYSAGAVILAGTDFTLRSVLISVGFILFSLRAIHYLKEVSDGLEPERDFLALAVYLISFENMLLSPLGSYESQRGLIANRRPTLSKMSAGLSAFIKGFAKTAVFGLSFERVRLAAVSGSAFPWANAVVLLIVTFGETYVVASGVLEMSRGLGLIGGLSPKGQTGAFLPRFRVGDHVGELWETLPQFAAECFFERSGLGLILSLAVISLLAGIFLSFGAGAAAFFGIILLAIILEAMSSRRSRAADLIFTIAVLAAGFLVLCCGSVSGIGRFFSAFAADYGYDITYALNEELLRSLPWLTAGAVFATPLTRIVSAVLREKMSESESLYSAARIAETVLCSLLLIIAAVSAAV